MKFVGLGHSFKLELAYVALGLCEINVDLARRMEQVKEDTGKFIDVALFKQQACLSNRLRKAAHSARDRHATAGKGLDGDGGERFGRP
jgi:hypothetical protein